MLDMSPAPAFDLTTSLRGDLGRSRNGGAGLQRRHKIQHYKTAALWGKAGAGGGGGGGFAAALRRAVQIETGLRIYGKIRMRSFFEGCIFAKSGNGYALLFPGGLGMVAVMLLLNVFHVENGPQALCPSCMHIRIGT